MTLKTGSSGQADARDVVVGFDDFPSTRAALAWAAAFARSNGARLRAVHVFREDFGLPVTGTTGFPAGEAAVVASREAVQDTLSGLFGSTAPEPGWTLEFRDGPVGPELVRAAAGAALLVVGTREHVGLERLVTGSVSHYCLSHARCPVAAVPAPGRVGGPVTAAPAPEIEVGGSGSTGSAGHDAPPDSPAVVLGVLTAEPEASAAAMDFALQEAHRRGLPVRVVHGCGVGSQLTPETPWAKAEQVAAGGRVLGLVAQRLRRRSRFETPVETVNSASSAVDALLTASGSAAVVVLEARRRHGHDLAGPGSTTHAVAARAACPVVVLHGDRAGSGSGGIVVGVEEHGRAQNAIRVAMEEAERAGLPVTAVHAWEVPMNVRTTGYVPATPDELALAHEAANRVLSEALAGLGEDFPTVELRRRAVRGPVVDVLRSVAAEASLLVVARHRGSRPAFTALGHTARALLHDAPCPLMLTPPTSPGHRRPGRLAGDVAIGTGY